MEFLHAGETGINDNIFIILDLTRVEERLRLNPKIGEFIHEIHDIIEKVNILADLFDDIINASPSSLR